MISIKIQKGYDLKIAGSPSPALKSLPPPQEVALLPARIPFIKPRLLIREGDTVETGAPLFEDKRNPAVKFCSPGGGRIARIMFGPRRVIEEIVITLDQDEPCREFQSFSDTALDNTDPDALSAHLLEGGIWPLIRSFPFRDIARPEHKPPAIYVSLDAKEPFQPRPEVYLKDAGDDFAFGIRALKKFSPDVRISASHDNAFVLKEFFQKPADAAITHIHEGPYPADDPGVLLYHTRTSPTDNRAWYIKGQDVIHLGQFLKSGRYPVDRVVTLAGECAQEPKHYKTRMGVPLAHVSGAGTKAEAETKSGNMTTKNIRHVVGGLFTGYSGNPDSFMGFYETSLTLIPEGNVGEFMGFIVPGYEKPSVSRTFFSVFNKSDLIMNTNKNGGIRGCVNCGTCMSVCPVDIFPQFTMKCVLADAVEESLEHGLLDCVECGLCSYVCPSKIEIRDILKDAKAAYYLEQG